MEFNEFMVYLGLGFIFTCAIRNFIIYKIEQEALKMVIEIMANDERIIDYYINNSNYIKNLFTLNKWTIKQFYPYLVEKYEDINNYNNAGY